MSTIKLKPRGRKYFSRERQYVLTVAVIEGRPIILMFFFYIENQPTAFENVEELGAVS